MKTPHAPATALRPGSKVRFALPVDDSERSAVMTVIEDRDDRVLVQDDRFADWSLPPQSVFAKADLEPVMPASDATKL